MARPLPWRLVRAAGKDLEFSTVKAAMGWADRYKKGEVTVRHAHTGVTWVRRRGQWTVTDPGKTAGRV